VTTTFHPPSSVGRLAIPLTTFAAAAAVLWFTGPRLAHVAARLADQSGLGGTFVGTTLVALTTSLPELVTAIVAVRAGAYDLAIGNTFGSNAFNMVIFLPLDMAHDGSLFAAVAVLGQLYRIEGRIPLCEPDSLLVLLIVVGALLLVYRLS
jgi:cation:H+ antiporter